MKRKYISALLMCFVLTVSLSIIVKADSELNLMWDGYNPFHQPVSTTYYYGSGDANLDGVFDMDDVWYVRDIIRGNKEKNIMADVNGDGKVDMADLLLMSQTLRNDGVLPGWWNMLTTREQREDWVMKMLAIYKTNLQPVDSVYNIHEKLHSDFSFRRWENLASGSGFNQTIFNLPMYIGECSPRVLGVTDFNAILVGNDPLNKADWLYINLNNDATVVPLPRGTRYFLKTAQNFLIRGDALNSYYQDYNSEFILTRPTFYESTIINSKDRWNPKVLDSGHIMFEQRPDISQAPDIYLMDFLPYDINNSAHPITIGDGHNELLDVHTSEDGSNYIMWFEKHSYNNRDSEVYFGKIDTETRTISEKELLGTLNNSYAQNTKGLILTTPDGRIHTFFHDGDKKIFWRFRSGSVWSVNTQIVDNANYVIPNYYRTDNMIYIFDAIVTNDGNIAIAWKCSGHFINYKEYSLQTHSWSNKEDVGWINPSHISQYLKTYKGLSLVSDGQNTYLAYWDTDGHINLTSRYQTVHWRLQRPHWTRPTLIDESVSENGVRLASDGKGKIAMVWTRKIGSHLYPVYTMNKNSYSASMDKPKIISVRDGASAYYPDITFTKDNDIYVYWSSRSNEGLEIETYKINDVKSDPSLSPVLYYDFDEFGSGTPDAIDKSGNNNTGSRGGWHYSIQGIKNNGYNAAVYNSITVPNSSSINFGTKDFSISCWVKTSERNCIIIEKRVSSNGVGYSLELSNGNPVLKVTDSFGSTNYTAFFHSEATKVNDNEWHLITVTMERASSTGVKIYIDGILQNDIMVGEANALLRSGNLDNTGSLIINGGVSRSMKLVGIIDEVRLYDRVLQSDEILNLYNDYYSIIKLPFDGNLNDVSGNGNAPQSTFATFVPGAINKGINLNLSNVLRIPYNPTQNIGTNDFTISFWIKRSNTNLSREVIFERSYAGGNGYSVEICPTYGLRFNILAVSNSPSLFPSSNLKNELFDDQWHHVLINKSNEELRFYVDGIYKGNASNTFLNQAFSSTSDMYFDTSSNFQTKFKGEIDDFRIYIKKLTPSDIYADPSIYIKEPPEVPILIDETYFELQTKRVSLGDTQSRVLNIFGSPDRIATSEYGFQWYVYNKDYANYIQIGIENNVVVALSSNALNLKGVIPLTLNESDFELLNFEIGTSKNIIKEFFSSLKSVWRGPYLVEGIETRRSFLENIKTKDLLIRVSYDEHASNELCAILVMNKDIYENSQRTYPNEVVESLEKEVFDLTNAFRVRHETRVLSSQSVVMSWCDKAALAARNHSEDMHIRSYYAHNSPDGLTHTQRLNSSGVIFSRCGENILQQAQCAIEAHVAWINSVGHRWNILNSYTHTGVGYCFGDGKRIFTQKFYE
ncbi:UNVERIFIED_CONTAM: dockerin type I repeat protein [Acetivibrio alkalicellulosi]